MRLLTRFASLLFPAIFCFALFFPIFPTSAADTVATSTIATTPDGTKIIELTNPLNFKTVPEIISSILRAAIGIVGALALLVFIYGGFVWLTSGGDSAKVTQGKEAMKWTAIGLVVIFTSYGLVRFVIGAFTQ